MADIMYVSEGRQSKSMQCNENLMKTGLELKQKLVQVLDFKKGRNHQIC